MKILKVSAVFDKIWLCLLESIEIKDDIMSGFLKNYLYVEVPSKDIVLSILSELTDNLDTSLNILFFLFIRTRKEFLLQDNPSLA